MSFSIKTLVISGFFLLSFCSTIQAKDIPNRIVTPRGEFSADEKNTIDLFENTRDSVVYISTAELVRDAWTRNIFTVPKGTGSGFIWDEYGHVVTNFHVIAGANEATVKLVDGRDYKATLVGASPLHDIAVLKIGVDFKKPSPVPIGTSYDLRVGQKVYAIGNPFGLDWTLTSGIVSALDRSLPGDNGQTVEHLIQTDAAINPGNSGGPLLDSARRLIGINTAIYSPSGASAGIGFAIPVDVVMKVVPELINKGKYIRPTLGVEIDEQANEQFTHMLGIEGVVILNVKPGSFAEKAGLTGVTMLNKNSWTPGDIITEFNGKKIDSVQKLLARLNDQQVGDVIKLTVLRNGHEREVDIKL